MLVTPPRKNKIALCDYPYLRDIEHRLFMSLLSVTEVDILREIVNHSVKIFSEDIAEALEISLEELNPFLKKLHQIRFLTLKDTYMIVDKDLRRYYEAQLIKFDEHFRPGIDYLQSLLNKVPIHVLPAWYAIPKTSDNIFDSIIEKYLSTPKNYRAYLQELTFDEPALKGITQDLFSAADYRIPSQELRKKYELSAEEFEELMLHLEFNLICCLSYQRVGDVWQEVVCPFYEWGEYLRFERDNRPKPIEAKAAICCDSQVEFGFLKDITSFLGSLKLSHKKRGGQEIDRTLIQQAIKGLKDQPWQGLEEGQDRFEYLYRMIVRLIELQLIDTEEGVFKANKNGLYFLELPSLQEKAIYWYRHITQEADSSFKDKSLCNDRNLRNVEQSLKPFVSSGWVYYDDFLKSMTVPIGETPGVMIAQMGKKWNYAIPQYSPTEKQFIDTVVLKLFKECGLILTGQADGRTCFQVTPFGRVSIGD
ncbi:MAG: hypothetical protein K0S07_1286 [Chlamydiales bacterium]|jgi:predicted transcriptional regulator|nr:hypothetical protein [Chlamydiales bacterium]